MCFKYLTLFSIWGLISGGLIPEFLKWYYFSKMVPNLFRVLTPFFNRVLNFRGFNFRISQMVPNLFRVFDPFFNRGFNFRGFNISIFKRYHFVSDFTLFRKWYQVCFGFLTLFSIGGLILGGLIPEFLKWYYFSKMAPDLFRVFTLFSIGGLITGG